HGPVRSVRPQQSALRGSHPADGAKRASRVARICATIGSGCEVDNCHPSRADPTVDPVPIGETGLQAVWDIDHSAKVDAGKRSVPARTRWRRRDEHQQNHSSRYAPPTSSAVPRLWSFRQAQGWSTADAAHPPNARVSLLANQIEATEASNP